MLSGHRRSFKSRSKSRNKSMMDIPNKGEGVETVKDIPI
jgi:hypothetical protein